MTNITSLIKDKTDIIFDLDETISTLLIDWSEFKAGMLARLTEKYPNIGSELNLDISAIDIANQVIEIYEREAKDLISEFAKKYEAEYYSGHQVNQLLVNFIKNNHDKYNLYLWTNNQRPVADLVLEDIGIDNYFDLTVTASDTLFYKPNIEGFGIIKKVNNSQNDSFIMIGDSRHDMLAAKNSQIEFINVRDLV